VNWLSAIQASGLCGIQIWFLQLTKSVLSGGRRRLFRILSPFVLDQMFRGLRRAFWRDKVTLLWLFVKTCLLSLTVPKPCLLLFLFWRGYGHNELCLTWQQITEKTVYNNYGLASTGCQDFFSASYSETILFISILANGITKRLVGKATAKPIIHPFTNLWRNPAVHPVFIEVIVKVIVVSKANVMIIAINKPEYFLLSFKAGNHPLGVSPHCSCISCLFLVTFALGILKWKLPVSLKYEEYTPLL